MDNCILKAMFDEMWDRSQDGGETEMEDIHAEIMKHWRDFLSAGFDANKVAAMMSPMEAFTYYDVLTSHGAEIDATELAFKLEDVDFVKKHLADFAKRGADINRIAKELFRYDLWLYSDDEIEKLIEIGVDATVVFEISNERLSLEAAASDRTDDLRSLLSLFLNHGVSIEKIQEWVMGNRSIFIVEDIVQNPENWEKFDIKATDELISEFMTIVDWIRWILEDMKIYLPKTVSPEKFLEYISVDDVITMGGSYEFENFMDSYEEVGGKLEKLAEWFFNEKGYVPDELCISAMFDIIWRDPSLIDLEKFIDCCNKCDEMTDEERHSYYKCLLEKEGVDKSILVKLL